MKCLNCGTENEIGNKFYKKCGAKLAMRGTTIACIGGLTSVIGSGVILTGLILIGIGALLCLTLIGMVIGLPMIFAGVICLIVGLIPFVGGAIVALLGVLKGGMNYFIGRKFSARRETSVKDRRKTREKLKIAGLVFIGILLLPLFFVGIIPLYFAYKGWKNLQNSRPSRNEKLCN